MSIFTIHEQVIDNYSKYVQSFFSISDERIRSFVEKEILNQKTLWPDALVQLNPSYECAATAEELVRQGKLHPLIANIFRTNQNTSIVFYRHQVEAFERALKREHYVVTSGTGSGKSFTYFIPIFNAVLHGRSQENKVYAIVVYPMNALVNSQYEALEKLASGYKSRTGKEFPIRFKKYTGQERDIEKQHVQNNPPHILLTNYVMLELMLVRPEEHNFVDRTTTGLQFLVIDELHTYRGRQGADVSLLIRRLRERCGNPNMLCIGTSATMVTGRKAASPDEKLREVAEFASKLFGVSVSPKNVIEESLHRVTSVSNVPTTGELRNAIQSSLPETFDEILENPLTAWIELTFGIEQKETNKLQRRIPITLAKGTEMLSEITGIDISRCKDFLRKYFIKGSQIKRPDESPLFAFKLHQFITQGRNIYATLELPSERYITLDGQYYAPGSKGNRVLYPLKFCRICGQDYYTVIIDADNNRLLPFEDQEDFSESNCSVGYLIITPNYETDWSIEHIPAEWLDRNGRIKSNYRECIPREIWISPDESISEVQKDGTVKGWFQPKPFMLCLNCGEFYTKRDKFDFRKLSGLSSEGRSTATTVLTISTLQFAKEAGIEDTARKVLSFTDNRQDASLQAGHFNDFLHVSLLRAAIFAALERHEKLSFDDIAKKVVSSMQLITRDIATNPNLEPDTPEGRDVWYTFYDLVEYYIYEDLRRGWRVIQPNLEQCNLLKINYKGLDELCCNDTDWEALPPYRELSPEKRKEIIGSVLDHFRKKLAINVSCLKEQHQQQLRRRVNQRLNEQWRFEENERLRTASYFILPGQTRELFDGISLAENSLIGRYLRRTLERSESYPDFIKALMDILSSYGLIIKDSVRNIEVVQLNAATIIWQKSDGTPPQPDPIYSRRVLGAVYADVQRSINLFFRDFYQKAAISLLKVEGHEHTAQISYESREKYERHFREGQLACLFCSPTMELGIDIADLHFVHLRNIPPTPANYAQRSGRAGRKGLPALVLSYCASRSGHDQYFFHHREGMVAGAVVPPKIDLGNEDLIIAHVHALWLAKTQLSLGSHIDEILELRRENYPLNENIQSQIQLSETRWLECLNEAKRILQSCGLDLLESNWHSQGWLENVLRQTPEEFDRAFNRWRELYKTADKQWSEANEILRYPTRDREKRERAENQRREAERQKKLLFNEQTAREETDFYPYRYLASEGFLPGYNFPRLPVRAYIPREDGEFISRPRFLAITEFGPQSIIYHEGAKYQADRLIAPPGGLQERRTRVKLCNICGYFHRCSDIDLCENCKTRLEGQNSQMVSLLEMSNVKARRRERITSDEEERQRWGFEITTHYHFATDPGNQKRIIEGHVYNAANAPIFKLIYAPSATLFRINHGWRRSNDRGFAIDLSSGQWLGGAEPDTEGAPTGASRQPDVIRLFVHDTQNILLLYFVQESLLKDENIQATLQYALLRGIYEVFQIEESELLSERIGSGNQRAILFWEASEGGVGVLRRLVEDRDVMAQVALAALGRCHFNPQTLEDMNPQCVCACYECLLSYTNQRDSSRINRHLIKDMLLEISQCVTNLQHGKRDYEEHHRWLRSLTDTRSELERKFIDYIYQTKRRLPDEAQKPLVDYACIPDFFYESNVCVFCDGSVHDTPEQKERDSIIRRELKEKGYRVVVVRYDSGIEEQISRYQDIFGNRK